MTTPGAVTSEQLQVAVWERLDRESVVEGVLTISNPILFGGFARFCKYAYRNRIGEYRRWLGVSPSFAIFSSGAVLFISPNRVQGYG